LLTCAEAQNKLQSAMFLGDEGINEYFARLASLIFSSDEEMISRYQTQFGSPKGGFPKKQSKVIIFFKMVVFSGEQR
jgi:hypothetical protein